MPMNKPTPFNMPPTYSNAEKPKWLVLGDDKFIIKLDKIISVSCAKNYVDMQLENGRNIVYNAPTNEDAQQEVKEIINILLERSVNEKS